MENNEKKPFFKELISWVACIAAAVIIGMVLRTFVFEPVRVDGDSMNDTLANGEIMFVEKITRYSENFERGDIVIVHYPGSKAAYVKRIVGLAGDTVAVKDGKLYINGAAQEEPYILDPYINGEIESVVPEGHIFVMGDNRNNSLDSRFAAVGPIPYDEVVGHATSVIWPISAWRGIDE